MVFTIKNEELSALNGSLTPNFPKYTSQLINWANQNAQGTRPKVVGQLSDLFPDYQKEAGEITLNGWRKWYTERYPGAIDAATDKIFGQMEHLKTAIQLIDREMIRTWVEDLVITKTYHGLYVQRAILAKIADMRNTDYRLAKPEEESLGIDGYVGNTAYSVKPDSYQTMDRLPEAIPVKMIYYTKKKSGLVIEVED